MKIQMYLPTGPKWDALLSILNFRKRLGKWPRLHKPETFNEHFLREKINFSGDIELAKTLTDKEKIKSWLIENGYKSHLIPTFFVAYKIDDLVDRLIPPKCVIKPTHSSGDVIILNNDNERKLTNVELDRIKKWFKEDYYIRGREPNYKNLIPGVIIEELLLDESGQPPKDYKFQCADGEPFMIQVDINRFSNHERQLYTIDWKLLPYCTLYPRHPFPQPAPSQLSVALELVRKLSANFKLCRVDLYFIGNKDIRIGEITFFPGNGAEIFIPHTGDLEAGSLINSILQKD